MQIARFSQTYTARIIGHLLLTGAVICSSASAVYAQSIDAEPNTGRQMLSFEYRTIDGSFNNLIDESMGAAHTPLVRHAPSAYGDGVQSLAGSDRPSARQISNVMSELPSPPTNSVGPTDFIWAWGQFLDHDLSITESAHPLEPAPISVPAGDPWFDPFNSGAVTMTFNRSMHDLDSGTGSNNPRQQVNEITAWIDASMVYGSNEVRASALRMNDGTGRMKMSPGRLLPFNTAGLPNAGGTHESLFLAGDVRANEQVALTALHTLFVREHNRLTKKIRNRSPELDGESVYQIARRIVGAQIQHITYREYLPVLLGRSTIPKYRGYKPWVDATIANEFSTALYRYGHSAIGTKILRLNRNLRETRHGHLNLKDAFFSPATLINEGKLSPLFRGLASQVCQKVDMSLVDDLRNFLFGPPGAGGFDLAALNIQRGRDHGLSDYNTTRVAFGLSRATGFDDISSDPAIQDRLYALYGDIDNVDLWVGALAEDKHSGMVGELLATALGEQFSALRNGDRFWYQRTLNAWELKQLAPLSKIIKRNTSVGNELRKNVFVIR